MNKRMLTNCLLLFVVLCLAYGFESRADDTSDTSPVPFIIDTDFSSDVDDVLAMSVACYYQDMGLIDIQGVALCCTSTNGAYGMSALLRQHGVYDVPIACDWDDGIPIGSKYHRTLMQFGYDDTYFSDVVGFYRMLLASSSEKVTIVTLGELTNIYLLLDSEPDVHSPLTGMELVEEKVECIYVVGGKSNGQIENNIFFCGDENISTNRWKNGGARVAAQSVAKDCPVPMVWMESDLIGGFTVGQFFCEESSSDIISKALTAYGSEQGSYSFDPFGVVIAALDSNGLLDTIGIEKIPGKMSVTLNGTSYFTDYEHGKHCRIQKLNADSYYQGLINQALKYEFNKRHGILLKKEV